MIEAGLVAYDYWNCDSELSVTVLPKLIYRVMTAVAAGRVSLDQVKDHANPKTGPQFFQRFL
jgi:hypothetical protein